VRSTVAAYGVAVAAVLAAVLLRWLLDPVMGDTLPLVTLFGVVAATVWLGGYRPALLVVVLGYLACAYLFIQPRGDLGLHEARNVVGLVAYLVTCSIIIGLGEVMRLAQRRAEVGREFLRVTISSVGDAVITTDMEGRVATLNPVAEALTGWTHQDARGRPLETVFKIINEERRKPVENPVKKVLEKGVVVGLANHTVLIAKDGTERPIDDSAAPIRDGQAQVVGCVLIFRDITDRRRAERLIADARAYAESIVATVREPLLVLDGELRVKSASRSFYRTFGVTPQETENCLIYEVGNRQWDIAALRKLLADILPQNTMFNDYEVEHIFPTIGHRVMLLNARRLYREGNHTELILLAIEDITFEKEAERRAYDLMIQLKDADRRKDEFLAMLGHELRGPLAPLSNMLEIMKRAEGNGDLLQQARSTMERQLGQLVRLVDDLIDVGRITRNKIELRKECIELASVIHQSVEACRPLAECANLQVSVTLPPEPIYLYADPVRLAQVFSNILNNACKYTEPGGRISLSAERQGSDVAVTVKDTGMGIPPDKLESVFEMFTQIDRTLERSQGGLGIGLTLAKRLVEMHEGTISAQSAGPGKGSEFVVRLPILIEKGKAETPKPTGAPAAMPRRILVVDDNTDAASSLAMLLKITGNEAHTANDGLEAVEAAEKFRPDVVLLDIGLPKLNGYDACRRIREQPWGKNMVMVALTGWGQEEDRRKSTESGFDAHMVKPVDYAALMKLLASRSTGGECQLTKR
jgi:PAS domain S-box-containing protein